MTKNAWLNKQILQKIPAMFVAGVMLATFFAQTPKAEAVGSPANNFKSGVSDTMRL